MNSRIQGENEIYSDLRTPRTLTLTSGRSVRKDSHPCRTKDLAVPSGASLTECGIAIGKCRSNKNTASNACGVFVAPERIFSYFYELKPLLLSWNSYILAPLKKPYISRLLVLPIPLILLIIRLFEIFWGHTGGHDFIRSYRFAPFLLSCLTPITRSFFQTSTPVVLPGSFSKTRFNAGSKFF